MFPMRYQQISAWFPGGQLVGCKISTKDGSFFITDIEDHFPLDKVQENDEVISINGRSVDGMSPEEFITEYRRLRNERKLLVLLRKVEVDLTVPRSRRQQHLAGRRAPAPGADAATVEPQLLLVVDEVSKDEETAPAPVEPQLLVDADVAITFLLVVDAVVKDVIPTESHRRCLRRTTLLLMKMLAHKR